MASTNLERVDNLFLPACALSSSMGTWSYALYLLACLQNKGKPMSENSISFLKGDFAAIRQANRDLAKTFSTAALGSILYEARSILRLFRIVPTTAKLRQVYEEQGQDSQLRVLKLVECSLYALYQGIENAATLVEYKILPRMRSSTHLYTLAYRVWLLSFSCSMIRMFREAKVWVIGKQKPTHLHLLQWVWIPFQWCASGWLEHQLPGTHMVLHAIGDGFHEVRHHTKVVTGGEVAVVKSQQP